MVQELLLSFCGECGAKRTASTHTCACRWVMQEPKFMWMTASQWVAEDGSFWGVLIIYNVSDGFTRVEQLVRSLSAALCVKLPWQMLHYVAASYASFYFTIIYREITGDICI